MNNELKVSNEQIDKKLESFVEVTLQKMIDLHQEIKTLKKKVHDVEKKLQASNSNEADERIGV